MDSSTKALTESEARYRLLFESNPQPMWVYDAETLAFLAVNKAAIRHYGYSMEEFLSMSLKDIRPAEELSPFLVNVGGASGEFDTVDVWKHRKKDGTRIDVEITSHSIDFSGRRACLVLANDVTERMQAERESKATNQRLTQALAELHLKRDELAAMTQQLWQASKLATMGELSASIAHELNNPLATVGLHIENLLMQLPADSPQRKPLEIIVQEVDRMAALVDNLLQFSRRSHRQVSTVDVREEIANSVELVRYHLRNRRIEVVREFPTSLPTIQADRQQLRQLFLNLSTNASDAMPEGGKLIARAASSKLNDTVAVMIEFADTGEGISAENLEKIWDPFFTTKPEGKGTGLGLAICRRIVEEHGGTIEIQSQAKLGTRVRMIFPATGNEVTGE